MKLCGYCEYGYRLFMTDCGKVYIPEQGEHLEVTGVDDLAAEEFQRYRELWAKFK